MRYKHPPGEVAALFQEEIQSAGGDMPLMMFAILDDHNTRQDHNPQGNFQPFYDALHQTGWDQEVDIGDPNAQTRAKPKTGAGMEVDTVTVTGTGEGPVAPIASGPDSHQAKESIAAGSDDPMGAALPAAPAHYDSRPDIQVPFTSDASEAQGRDIGAASGSATEDLEPVIKPADTRNIVVFKPTISAREEQRKSATEHVYIFSSPAAACDDVAAPTLLAMLVKKYSETAKWQRRWDGMKEEERINVCSRGMQRRGNKTSSAPYNYHTDVTPPYEPQSNTEIEKQCADFLEFATERCKLPISFWLSSTARANQGVSVPGIPMHMQEGDFRVSMALTITRAMHDKAWCTFIPHRGTPRNDTYYFPEGMAFTNEGKSSTLAAASILIGNPDAKLPLKIWMKGNEWNKNLNMLCDVQQPPGLLAGVEPMAKAKAKAKSTSSSSTTAAAPVVKKRPAAQK
jgi:hypothetical protein